MSRSVIMPTRCPSASTTGREPKSWSHKSCAARPRESLVLHVFNHATHHRGQASIALLQLGCEAPVMDMPYFLNELPAHKLHAA